MTFDAVAVQEVRQAIWAEFVKGLRRLDINPDLSLGSSVASARSNISTCPYIVIDLVTLLATPSMLLH